MCVHVCVRILVLCVSAWYRAFHGYQSNKSKRFKQISFPTLSWSTRLLCIHGRLIAPGWIIASLHFSFWSLCWSSHIWRLCLISLIDVRVMLTQLVMTREQLWSRLHDLPCVLGWFLILFWSLYVTFVHQQTQFTELSLQCQMLEQGHKGARCWK